MSLNENIFNDWIKFFLEVIGCLVEIKMLGVGYFFWRYWLVGFMVFKRL